MYSCIHCISLHYYARPDFGGSSVAIALSTIAITHLYIISIHSYIHDAIPCKQRKDLELGGKPVFIEVNGHIFNTMKNVLLAVIYRSPDSPLGLFNEQLEHTLLQIDKEKKVALLSGDFNCDTYRELSVNPVVTQDFNTFSSFNYHKLITQPTRIVRETGHIKSATLLDNIYVSNKNWEDGFSGILHTDENLGLDHKAIFTIRENACIPKMPEYRILRDICIRNVFKLKKCYKNKDWNELYALELARDASSFFIRFLQDLFVICCPEKAVKITYHNRNPWMDKSLKQDIARREKLLKIKTKDPSEENVSLFKKCRNRVIHIRVGSFLRYALHNITISI